MPSYKVIYFDFTGRAEPIRWLFSYGNIPFTDQRVSREEWVKLKPTTPFGQLPVLEIDGEPAAQSNALCRYVANLVGLDGKDAKENLAINQIVDAAEDLQKGVIEMFFCKDEDKKKELKAKFVSSSEVLLKNFDDRAGKNGGYLALNRLTWADIIVVLNYESWVNSVDQDVFKPYPNLQKVKKNVLSQDGIRNWIKTRPENKMKPKYDIKQDL
ncbi:unnamed protein product [Phyllotreta striolata]|uniref:glutathione transferase n=1 Tax=Phyllotreta striolata TaxID=444603 RepID=A0A9N9TGP8_PHYSR|nr:unnamed protein product [Phyllotreta striolata]